MEKPAGLSTHSESSVLPSGLLSSSFCRRWLQAIDSQPYDQLELMNIALEIEDANRILVGYDFTIASFNSTPCFLAFISRWACETVD